MNRNGYAASIMVANTNECALCHRTAGAKLDRHEPWGGPNRQKSKALGLWVPLCHLGCHEGPGSVHANPALNRIFRRKAQKAAMDAFGWTVDDFIRAFGKSELSEYVPAPESAEDCGFVILDDEAPY